MILLDKKCYIYGFLWGKTLLFFSRLLDHLVLVSGEHKNPRTTQPISGFSALPFAATDIAMIIAIVTSREAEPGKSKWLTNNDLAKSFSWTISQTGPNKTTNKQKIHGILLMYCPKNTIYFKKQTFQGLKTRSF